jgi:hypothetical protein
MEHLTIQQILFIARRGEESEHASECAFCQEQLELACDFLSFSHADESMLGVCAEEIPVNSGYRLAAQSLEPGSAMFRLRRTWYLQNNSIVLRVIEDLQKNILTGFFISEMGEMAHVRIRFDGIDREYVPDLNGVFEIGSASIDIEPMNVSVITL